MNARKIKIIAATLCFGLFNIFTIKAYDKFSVDSEKQCVNMSSSESEKLFDEIYVSDIFELLTAVERVSTWGKIILKNDIDLCGLTLVLNKSMVLDLNNHTLTVDGGQNSVTVEHKVITNQKKIIREYPSDYVWDDKEHKVKQPFWGGDDYKLIIVDYESHEEYDDSIFVTIRNGKIVRKSGEDGEMGKKCTWSKCHGKNGVTPKAPLNINSGTTYLNNMQIIGGDGGNGGSGAYYPGEHLPFSGGCGADGGNGGNGGSAVMVSRSQCGVVVKDNCKLISGKPGKGGAGGDPSPNYWFHRSKPGKAGRDGIENPKIIYAY